MRYAMPPPYPSIYTNFQVGLEVNNRRSEDHGIDSRRLSFGRGREAVALARACQGRGRASPGAARAQPKPILPLLLP